MKNSIIKNYGDWLNESLSHSADCGCGGSTRTDLTSGMPVLNLNELLSINEAFTPKKGGSETVVCNYSPGYYSLKGTDAAGNTYDNEVKLKPVIDKAIAFLKTEPASTFISEFVITSGESILPNYDMEGKTGKKDSGWLSEQRRKKIEAYAKAQLKEMVDQKIISKEPVIKFFFQDAKTLTEPSGGFEDYRNWRKSTPEQQAANPKNAEYAKLKAGYDADQFTKIQIKIVPDLGPNQCMLGLKVAINYDENKGHTCDFANYEITANGVVLSTGPGSSVPGKPYATLNNSGNDEYSRTVKRAKDSGGFRYNYFYINDAELVKKIVAASPDKTNVIIVFKAKCITPGFNNDSNRCHEDAPHVYVWTDNGLKLAKGFPTYPGAKINAQGGELFRTDKCGNLIGTQVTTTANSADAKTTGTAAAKPTGIKLSFAAQATGTLTTDQAIQNFVNSGNVVKQPDNTYQVVKAFTNGTVSYKVGDVINKLEKKGTVIVDPRATSTPGTAPTGNPTATPTTNTTTIKP